MAEKVLEDLKLGDSIAINGACMTVAALSGETFVVQTSPESVQRTTLDRLRPGDAVNLERAVQAGGRFGGHFVSGHVDGIGRVGSIQHQGEFSLWRFQAPAEVARYIVPKGSVAVDGISLTVVEPAGETFGVAVIPTTIEQTTLAAKRPGDPVNLEVDVISKHVYHYLNPGTPGTTGPATGSLTLDVLKRQGFA